MFAIHSCHSLLPFTLAMPAQEGPRDSALLPLLVHYFQEPQPGHGIQTADCRSTCGGGLLQCLAGGNDHAFPVSCAQHKQFAAQGCALTAMESNDCQILRCAELWPLVSNFLFACFSCIVRARLSGTGSQHGQPRTMHYFSLKS